MCIFVPVMAYYIVKVHKNYVPSGLKASLMLYDTMTFALLTTIVTEWFPGGLTSLFSMRGRVPESDIYIEVSKMSRSVLLYSHMDGEVPH